MSERKRAIRNLILKAQNIPLNDLQTLMVVNEIQTKVMTVVPEGEKHWGGQL